MYKVIITYRNRQEHLLMFPTKDAAVSYYIKNMFKYYCLELFDDKGNQLEGVINP